MNRHRHIIRLAAWITIPVLLMGASGGIYVVKPTVAGIWYPADKAQLEAAVGKCLDEAEGTVPAGRVVACIVPHAPYATFGSVAGAAFKCLKAGHYDRVIVLAPAHFSSFRGCSIPSAQAWLTPLAATVLDGPAIRALDRSPLIEVRALNYKGGVDEKGGDRVKLHEQEYCIEAVMPFLQVRLGEFLLIPIVVGEFLDYNKRFDENGIAAVATMIKQQLTDRTLLVVSSDFTHFGNNFSYRPFRDHILEGIEALDKEAFRLILERDYEGYQTYLEDTKNTICGKEAIAILLKCLPKDAVGHLMKYEVSARRTNDTTSSISYASIVFVTPEQASSKGKNAE